MKKKKRIGKYIARHNSCKYIMMSVSFIFLSFVSFSIIYFVIQFNDKKTEF